MPRTRVHNLFVSSDGFAAGDYVTLEQPIGEAQALFALFDGRVIHGIHGVDEPVTVDRALFSTWGQGIGAEIMGRRKYGPQTGEWPDDGWQGWWGDEPPFLTPVFILTHYPRESIEFANGTSFHFINASPEDALRLAQQAAGGLDVRIGGGPATLNSSAGRPHRLPACGDRAGRARHRRPDLGSPHRLGGPVHRRVDQHVQRADPSTVEQEALKMRRPKPPSSSGT